MTGEIFYSPVIENVTCHLGNPPVILTGRTGPVQRPGMNRPKNSQLTAKHDLVNCPYFLQKWPPNPKNWNSCKIQKEVERDTPW